MIAAGYGNRCWTDPGGKLAAADEELGKKISRWKKGTLWGQLGAGQDRAVLGEKDLKRGGCSMSTKKGGGGARRPQEQKRLSGRITASSR